MDCAPSEEELERAAEVVGVSEGLELADVGLGGLREEFGGEVG